MANMSVVAPAASQKRLSRAGVWRRTGAFALDYLFIGAYLGVLAGGAWALRQTPIWDTFAALYERPATAQATNALFLDLPVMLYFALFEASRWQATPGKRWLGLRVVTTEGKRLGLGRAVARNVLKLLPWEAAHTGLYQMPGWPLEPQATPVSFTLFSAAYLLAGLFLATALGSEIRQTLYDLLTRTRVVADLGASARPARTA